MPQTGSPASLQARHSLIEDRIRSEQLRPHPDDAAIADLKKRKLQIKDTLQAR